MAARGGGGEFAVILIFCAIILNYAIKNGCSGKVGLTHSLRSGFLTRRAYFFSTKTLKKRCCGVTSVHVASESDAFPFSTA